MSLTDLEITRKRLLWRATHRGIKEMDILVGGYAQLHLATMGQTELTHFADLLEIPDQDLLSWATKQSSVPLEQQSAMLEAMLRFLPEGNL
ncbi:MAG TPA: succinate dehydrogenase assembly factor 2 [Aestuariivirga sp.]